MHKLFPMNNIGESGKILIPVVRVLEKSFRVVTNPQLDFQKHPIGFFKTCNWMFQKHPIGRKTAPFSQVFRN